MTDSYVPIADLYDHVAAYRERPDVPFYVEEAVGAGGPVLELGCGTGRILIPSARAGARMVGLDASAAMLGICRRGVAEEPPEVRDRIELHDGDMRSFDLGARFALATIPFRAFQHLVTLDDQLACLESVRAHLMPGGRLIVDVFNPSFEAFVKRPLNEEIGHEPEFETPDGRRVVRCFRITAHRRADQVNETELIYYVTHPDGREERLVHRFDMRYLFRFELEHLLARAGFALEHLYAGYDKSPFGARYSSELIAVAAKST
jgi:SAM-dependent methyltransferase